MKSYTFGTPSPVAATTTNEKSSLVSLTRTNPTDLHCFLECAYVTENAVQEPMVGLAKLIEGSIYCNLKQFAEGIASFRECLAMRKHLPNSGGGTYVSAFAQYELGALLVGKPEVSIGFCQRFLPPAFVVLDKR